MLTGNYNNKCPVAKVQKDSPTEQMGVIGIRPSAEQETEGLRK
jgi:hypothetical protein